MEDSETSRDAIDTATSPTMPTLEVEPEVVTVSAGGLHTAELNCLVGQVNVESGHRFQATDLAGLHDLAYPSPMHGNQVVNLQSGVIPMSALARDAGLNRGNLCEALSEDGNPTMATLLKVANALGLRLRLEPVERPTPGVQPASAGVSRQGSTLM